MNLFQSTFPIHSINHFWNHSFIIYNTSFSNHLLYSIWYTITKSLFFIYSIQYIIYNIYSFIIQYIIYNITTIRNGNQLFVHYIIYNIQYLIKTKRNQTKRILYCVYYTVFNIWYNETVNETKTKSKQNPFIISYTIQDKDIVIGSRFLYLYNTSYTIHYPFNVFISYIIHYLYNEHFTMQYVVREWTHPCFVDSRKIAYNKQNRAFLTMFWLTFLGYIRHW